jgi:16S rRNA (adenine1518-N6/adenine1519-N6)-dimethyltransferase
MGMQKKFGQNFLINPNARKTLIDNLEAKEGDAVWEIGPGLGAMTADMLGRGFAVKAFEIDRGFIEALKDLFKDEAKFEIIAGDVLKTWKSALPASPYLFGNLPYNIGASIIADFIEQKCFFSRIVVTVQREVAGRMAAKPGTSDYSSFTVLCNMAYNVKPLMVLKGASFYPPPHVDSQGVRLDLKQDVNIDDYPLILTPMVRSLFSSRRKTVQNNLQNFISGYSQNSVNFGNNLRKSKQVTAFPLTSKEPFPTTEVLEKVNSSSRDLAAAALESCGISCMERAERLSLDEFTALAASLTKLSVTTFSLQNSSVEKASDNP